jgi:hypothetical protein
MATTNNAGQTNNASQNTNASQTTYASRPNTFRGDGYSHTLNYYQVVLTKGNRILLGSNIFTSYTEVENLHKEICEGGTQFIVNYVTAIPNMGHLNSHLQRNYRTEAGFHYHPSPEPRTPNQPIPDPELDSPPPVPSRQSRARGRTPPVAPVRPTRTQNPDFIASPYAGRVSTSGSSESDSAFPLPDASYFSTSSPLEVVGNRIPVSIPTDEDIWEHLDGEHLLESFKEEDEVEDTGPFTEMTISAYGKGFLLTPPEGHEDFGQKYYHNAWWMSKNNAWFFKEEHLDYFLDNGALWKLEHEAIDEMLNAIDSPVPKIFDEMSFEPYSDKGFLLQCYNTHPNYGDKFFHGGFWHRQGDGWFFSSDMRAFLEENGAEFEYDESTIFEGLNFHNGSSRGQFYLVPELDSKYYGLVGFEGGKWCHEYESWLFTEKEFQFFTSRGAQFMSWH